MDAQNVIYLGPRKDIVDLQSVKQRLQEEIGLMKKQNPAADPTVVLSVDRRVEYGPFLQLFSTTQEVSPKVRLVYKPGEGRNNDIFNTLKGKL